MTPSRKSRSEGAPMFGKEKSSDERRFRVAPDVSTELVGERASSAGVLLFSAVLFVVVLACVLGLNIRKRIPGVKKA